MRYSDLVRVHGSSVAESVGNLVRIVAVAKCRFAKSDALSDRSADTIYLGKQIIGRFGKVTGHPGKSCHVCDIEFGNSRRDKARGSQIGSGPGSGAESVEDLVWVVAVLKRFFTKLGALDDGSTDTIYLGSKIVSRSVRAGDHPRRAYFHASGIEFGTSRATRLGGVRSDLTPVMVLLSMVEELDVGFFGTVTSGKLPKVMERPIVAPIWMLTLVKKMTPVLAAIELDI